MALVSSGAIFLVHCELHEVDSPWKRGDSGDVAGSGNSGGASTTSGAGGASDGDGSGTGGAGATGGGGNTAGSGGNTAGSGGAAGIGGRGGSGGGGIAGVGGTAGAAGSAGASVVDAGMFDAGRLDAGTLDANALDSGPPRGDAGEIRDASVGGDGGPGSALHGFLYDLPCMSTPSNGDCQVATPTLTKTVMLPFGGDPNVTYNVRLHFCGPVEGRPFTGCSSMQATYFCVDGTAGTAQFDTTYPIYEMRVSAPAHSYFLNNRNLKDDLFMIDYSATLQIQGGSTITFTTMSTGTAWYTAAKNGHNFVCPSVPGISQPYAGQFIYVTVESVAP
jgi:hypothetical protein